MGWIIGIAAIVIGGIVIYGIIVGARRERLRKIGLQKWAQINRFDLSMDDPYNLDRRFNGVGDIGRGHSRYALEVLHRQDPVPTYLFRYHFQTTETRTVTRNGRTFTETYEKTHWRRYLVIELNRPMPGLSLRPEGLFDKVAGLVGFGDINFESEEFSRKYFCKSADRQFAYAIIHPQMMEWMMDKKLSLEIGNGLLTIPADRWEHSAEGCTQTLGLAVGFINRIPTFVWQDYGGGGEIKMDEPAACATPAEEIQMAKAQ